MNRSDDGLYHCNYTGAYDATGRRVHMCTFCDEKCYSFKACVAHQATHKQDDGALGKKIEIEGLKEQTVKKNILLDEQLMEQMVKTKLQKEQTMDKMLKMEHPEPEEHTTDEEVDMGPPEEQTMEKRLGMELLKQPIIEKRAKMELRGRYNPYPPSKMSKLPTHASIAFGISQNRYGGSSSSLGDVTKTGVSSCHSAVKNDSNTFSGSMEMAGKKESDKNRPIRILGFTVPETGVLSDDRKNNGVPATSSIKAAEPSQRTPKFNIDLNVIDLSD
ncbi:hypothetical protein FRX31_023148 [Thalictrum thalictroides]|uniref:Uncharacterized protein n=1 Tax=Thalictrum thalictroides TaxID=46969 RepID=A0A7J6VR80_THATH|nr:hypothetical protein FRX31_023148 [Thalictrum thalictroides]